MPAAPFGPTSAIASQPRRRTDQIRWTATHARKAGHANNLPAWLSAKKRLRSDRSSWCAGGVAPVVGSERWQRQFQGQFAPEECSRKLEARRILSFLAR